MTQMPSPARPQRRARASVKAAGSRFETAIAAYLAEHVDDRIERRRPTGARDRGDLSGLRVLGNRIVAECKDYGGRLLPGPWLREAELERGNDDAAAAFVLAKRRGRTAPGDQYVLMTVDDLVALPTGERPVMQAPGDHRLAGPLTGSAP